MKTNRLLFVSFLLPLFVAAAGALVLRGAPASAEFTTAVSSALVTMKGTVTGSPENVAFSGQAKIASKMVTDPDFNSVPAVVLTIDLSNLTGVGSVTGNKYVTSNQEILTRRLAATDLIQINFPFIPSGGSATSARVGVASFHLGFNVNSGILTSATGQVVTP